MHYLKCHTLKKKNMKSLTFNHLKYKKSTAIQNSQVKDPLIQMLFKFV